MDLIPPQVADYIEDLGRHHDPVLSEMEAHAEENDFPIVGPVVGRLLYQLTLLHRPRRIFELGSGFGYSAYWFALGLRDAGLYGQVVLTEYEEDNIDRARTWLGKAGLARYCDFRQGDALEHLSRDEGEAVDVFFNDIDKEDYPDSFEPMMERLKVGGQIIVDNMLWSGRPIEGDDDASTQGVEALTRLLYDDDRLSTSLLPLRDGVTVSVRLK